MVAWTFFRCLKRSGRKPGARTQAQKHLNFEGIMQGEKMKRPSVLVLLIFAFAGGNLFAGISSTSRSIKNSSDPGYEGIELRGRRLKEQHTFTIRKTRNLQNFTTDDYQPVDPSPSTKANIRAGPIEHGAPILPYIPRYPPPPGHHKDVPPAQSSAPPLGR